jgi:DNA polymerase III epsilon subunit family exonuclease
MDSTQSVFDFAAPVLGELSVRDVETVSFDFETTGLDPRVDRIVEIGAHLWKNGIIKDSLVTLVRQDRPIPAAATSVHGIRNEDLESAPDERTALLLLSDFIKERLAVAHNLPFDYGFLKSACRRHGLNTEGTLFIDTLTFSRRVYPTCKGYSLVKLIEYLQLEQENYHRAGSDAYGCGKLFFRILADTRETENMCIDELIKYSRSRKYK